MLRKGIRELWLLFLSGISISIFWPTILSKANENKCEIILPHDVVVASEFVANANFSIKNVTDISSLDMILDIGPSTCDKINEIFSISKTLIWNGPMGAFELKPFDKGTIDTSICASKLTKSGKLISVAAVSYTHLTLPTKA